jgi:hypothetical protein
MNIEFTRGKSIQLRRAAGNTIRVNAGAVWITEENSIQDVVLKAGESFQLAHSGLAIVEAFSDASVSLV